MSLLRSADEFLVCLKSKEAVLEWHARPATFRKSVELLLPTLISNDEFLECVYPLACVWGPGKYAGPVGILLELEVCSGTLAVVVLEVLSSGAFAAPGTGSCTGIPLKHYSF